MNKYLDILNHGDGILVNNRDELQKLFCTIGDEITITMTTIYVAELLFIDNDEIVITLNKTVGKHSGASDIVTLCSHYIDEFKNIGNKVVKFEEL